MKTLKLKTIVSLLVVVLIAWACQNESKKTENNSYTNTHKVTVKEVVQASAYTYLNVVENRETFWIAVSKRDIEPGTVLYYDDGLEMNNFESKDLNRTFETIYFVQNISDNPSLPGKQQPMAQPQPQKPALEKLDVNIEPAEGGVTISTLYANRETYKNQIVRIRGQVTKVNQSIMGKNWIHIQDGSDDAGNFDLTITTSQIAKVGDVVTFEGRISLNKDFGAGYKYEVIMEDAVKADDL